MKKQLSILLLSLTLISGALSAQKLDIDWGKSFDSSTEVQKIIGVNGTTMVALTNKGKKRFIETYNTEKGFVASKSEEYVIPKIEGNETGLLNIALREGKIFALVYGYNKKLKSFSIYAQQLTLEGKQIGKLDELYSSSAADEKIKDRIVDVRFSPDQSKVLMFFDRTNADRTKFYSDVVVVDLNNDEVEPTIEKEEFVMRSGKSESVIFRMYHSIDNEGNHFYMSERIELTKKVISDFTLSIKGFDLSGKSIGTADIKDEERVLLSPAIVSDKDHFVVVGYYMNNPRKRATVTGYAGLFVAKLGTDLSVESLKISKFSDKFFTDFYTEKRIAKMNSKGIEILVPAPYTMDKIVLHTDGTMTVFSEYFLITISDAPRGGRTTTTQYGNIIYYKVNPEGDILAADVIKKMQLSRTTSIALGGFASGSLSMFVSFETNDNAKKYWSYALASEENTVYLVFNDHLKNMNDDEDDLSKALTNPSKSIPYLVTITEDGKFTKKAMVESQDNDTYCVPQITYPLEEDKFIIWGVRRKENKFGVAEIK